MPLTVSNGVNLGKLLVNIQYKEPSSFKVMKRVRQRCKFSPYLFNLYN